jgi:putative phage-type endonuclease
MIMLACVQGTAEWKAARAGHVTASRISDVMAKIQKGEAASRRDYKAQIVAEILTGTPLEDGYVSPAMQWGTEQEPLARAAYEIATGEMVDQVGLVLHESIPRAASSPDGLVGSDGLIECKCPKTATHLGYILKNAVPPEYVPQMCWQLACTGRKWVDFVSYDPRLPEHLQLFIKRLVADPAYIELLECEVKKFLAEVDDLLLALDAVEKVTA